MAEKDKSGDTMGEYFVKVDDFSCKCLWCKKIIDFSSIGKGALVQHAGSKSHKAVAATRKGRDNTQMTFAVNQEENNNPDEEEENASSSTANNKARTTKQLKWPRVLLIKLMRSWSF